MNTTVSKRSFLTYSILNAISFGIYGIVMRGKIAADVETICAQDGQQPAHSFTQAWIYSKLYNLLIVGIFGLPSLLGAAIAASISRFANGFLTFFVGLIALVFIAFIFEGLYLPSWWYTQHNRLVLNSHRYKMVLNDNAFDTAVWKSIMYIPMALFSFLGYVTVVAGLVGFFGSLANHMGGIAFLSLVGGILLGAIFLFIKNLINLPLFYTMKSINRFSENMGITYAGAYDPMGLLDEDNHDNIFSRTIRVLENFGKEKPVEVVVEDPKTVIGKPADMSWQPPVAAPMVGGTIECVAGTNRGYVYNINEGEELTIGKDPKTANIVISAEFKDVSRKHCVIKYYQGQYILTDYSSNGTKVNGKKLEPGVPEKVSRGSQIALGKGDNLFKVK